MESGCSFNCITHSPSLPPALTHKPQRSEDGSRQGQTFNWNLRFVEGWCGTKPVFRGDWGVLGKGEALTLVFLQDFWEDLASFQALIVDSPSVDLDSKLASRAL